MCRWLCSRLDSSPCITRHAAPRIGRHAYAYAWSDTKKTCAVSVVDFFRLHVFNAFMLPNFWIGPVHPDYWQSKPETVTLLPTFCLFCAAEDIVRRVELETSLYIIWCLGWGAVYRWKVCIDQEKSLSVQRQVLKQEKLLSHLTERISLEQSYLSKTETTGMNVKYYDRCC